MTKRAKYIRCFVAELAELASNGLYIRTNATKPLSAKLEDVKRHLEAKLFLEMKTRNLEACLVEILENNPEQAEALMKDLKIEWVKPQTDNPPIVPPE